MKQTSGVMPPSEAVTGEEVTPEVDGSLDGSQTKPVEPKDNSGQGAQQGPGTELEAATDGAAHETPVDESEQELVDEVAEYSSEEDSSEYDPETDTEDDEEDETDGELEEDDIGGVVPTQEFMDVSDDNEDASPLRRGGKSRQKKSRRQ